MKTKILIIRLQAAKEVLLSTPFIRQVRMAYPDAQIDYLTCLPNAELLQYNPHIDRLFTIKAKANIFKIWPLRKKWNLSGYSFVFDLQDNRRTKFLTRFLPQKTILYNKEERTGQKKKRELNVPLRFLQTAGFFIDSAAGSEPEIFWKDEAEKKVYTFLKKENLLSGYIAIDLNMKNTLAGWPQTFLWRLTEIILTKSREKIVLLNTGTGASQRADIAEDERVISCNGSFSLLERAILISKAKVIIASVSLCADLAQAVRTPVFTVHDSSGFNADLTFQNLKAEVSLKLN